MRRFGSMVLLVVAMLSPALAGPRISGRITKIVPERRTVVIQRSDGKVVRAVLQSGAKMERMGTETKMAQFRVGDYVVLEVAGPLNDDPLECDGLYDIHTAGKAPPPVGSVNTTIQGGFAIPGGGAATVPFHYDNNVGAQVAGGSVNSSHVTFTPYWNPTRAWDGISGDANQTMPQPVFQQPTVSMSTHAPGVAQDTAATVGPYGPTRTTTTNNFPATPQGGTYSTQPSPAGNPWMAQAVGRNNNTAPPVPQSPVVSTTRTMPQTASPTQMIDPGDGSPAGIAAQARPGMDIVSLQGNVTQVMAAQRAFTMQAMVQGRAVTVQVRVPQQVGVMNARSQAMLGLENIRIGDYVMLTGIQMMPGAVEARKLYVNQ